MQPKAIENIQIELLKKHPLETGGILMGTYDNTYRLATVEFAMHPTPDSKHERSGFIRGIDGLNDMISVVQRTNPGTYYLGEWHSHPASKPVPSIIDILQMNTFARKRYYGSKSPILLIVGGTPIERLTWGATIHKSWRKPLTLFPI